MSREEYEKAKRLADRSYRGSIIKKEYPYLKVLDEMLPYINTVGEQDLGLIEIPIEKIVGTKSSGRTKAFASNFMPLLDVGSEFANKWSALYDSHIEEGIREPIIACEFLNSYYVIEGNKRVSVLKYSDAVSILGYVTRIVPERNGDTEIEVYYEFIEFSDFSGIYEIYFTQCGSFKKLCEHIGTEYGKKWSSDEQKDFKSNLLHFTKVYTDLGGSKIEIEVGDALLLYLDAFGYAHLNECTIADLKKDLNSIWSDVVALPEEKSVEILTQPDPIQSESLLHKLFTPTKAQLKVAFFNYRTPDVSGWTNSHTLGANYAASKMNDAISMQIFDDINTASECQAKMEEAIADGVEVIFSTSPLFLETSLNIALRYPEVKILNCCLCTYTGHLRTYYGRLYEAKFLVGVLAGILADSDDIGYIEYLPIMGVPAEINSFALGVKMTRPSARIHLEWDTLRDQDAEKKLLENGIHFICGRTTQKLHNASKKVGLYDAYDTDHINIAASTWNWGKFYRRILQTIVNGRWDQTKPDSSATSINYWWGLSSEMIDVSLSQKVPDRTLALIEIIRRQISSGEYQIFSDRLIDQEGNIRNENGHALTPSEIVQMDWLLDNVIGTIPNINDFNDEIINMTGLLSICPNSEN